MRATLRAGVYELLARADIPARVVINEYVDVALRLFGGGEPGFVNGVLDRLARELRRPEIEGGTVNDRPPWGEFALIAQTMAPLARLRPGAFGLTDDAAILGPRPGRSLVVTADAMVAGVHFAPEDPA